MAYDIIILAGQSNAEGNGHNNENERITFTDNVFQLVDVNPVYFEQQSDGKVVIKCSLPVQTSVQTFCERPTPDGYCAELCSAFAKHYVESGLLKYGRKLLVVKSAIGGTGFYKQQWGVGNVLYGRLCQMTKQALDLEKDSKIVAFLWHQGEHDAFEGQCFSLRENNDRYFNALQTMLADYRSRFGNIPIVTGGLVPHWAKGFAYAKGIEKSTAKVCENIGNATFVSSKGLLSNDQSNKSGDMIHFCRRSVYELGKRYFDAYCKLIKK